MHKAGQFIHCWDVAGSGGPLLLYSNQFHLNGLAAVLGWVQQGRVPKDVPISETRHMEYATNYVLVFTESMRRCDGNSAAFNSLHHAVWTCRGLMPLL
jgi:hypothetical protein